MRRSTSAVKVLFRERDGASAVEYALFISFVLLVCIGVIRTLGNAVSGVFEQPLSGDSKAGAAPAARAAVSSRHSTRKDALAIEPTCRPCVRFAHCFPQVGREDSSRIPMRTGRLIGPQINRERGLAHSPTSFAACDRGVFYCARDEKPRAAGARGPNV